MLCVISSYWIRVIISPQFFRLSSLPFGDNPTFVLVAVTTPWSNFKRHEWLNHDDQMEIFSALLVVCEGNPPVTGGFPSQKPVTWSFEVVLSAPEQSLTKQSSRRWFEMPSRSWSRHCYALPNHNKNRQSATRVHIYWGVLRHHISTLVSRSSLMEFLWKITNEWGVFSFHLKYHCVTPCIKILPIISLWIICSFFNK